MEDLEEGVFLPKIDLATVAVRRDLNDPNLSFELNEPIYLMKYPYVEKALDATTVILFLCSLKYNKFIFTWRYNLNRVIDGNLCNCRIIIYEIPDGIQIPAKKKKDKNNTKKIPEGFIYIDDKTDPIRLKKIFKLLFNLRGNEFYIQILGTSKHVNYDLIQVQRSYGKRNVYLYNYKFEYDSTLTTPYKIRYPKEIIKKISIAFNNKSSDPERNQFTSMLFYRFCPFHPKTIARNKFSLLNLNNDIYELFNRFSGHLLYVKGEGQFIFKGESIKAFAWLRPYFHDFVLKTNTIGLDATFRVLKPFKVCIPQCIIQNTGVPLGILVAPSESFNLYSLLFKL